MNAINSIASQEWFVGRAECPEAGSQVTVTRHEGDKEIAVTIAALPAIAKALIAAANGDTSAATELLASPAGHNLVRNTGYITDPVSRGMKMGTAPATLRDLLEKCVHHTWVAIQSKGEPIA